MQIDPHLGFNGNCEEAFNFYEKTFGGKIEFKMTYGESPMAAQMAPEARNLIMHISMRVGFRNDFSTGIIGEASGAARVSLGEHPSAGIV